MKMYPNFQVLYSQYVEGTWVDEIMRFPHQLANILSRIRLIVQNWLDKEAASADELEKSFASEARFSRARIKKYQSNFNIASAFISSRPDLKKLLETKLKPATKYSSSTEPNRKKYSNVVLDDWKHVMKQELYLQSRWADLVRTVKSDKDVKRCFLRHLKKIERADTVSDTDRQMLHLMNENQDDLRAAFRTSLKIQIAELG